MRQFVHLRIPCVEDNRRVTVFWLRYYCFSYCTYAYFWIRRNQTRENRMFAEPLTRIWKGALIDLETKISDFDVTLLKRTTENDCTNESPPSRHPIQKRLIEVPQRAQREFPLCHCSFAKNCESRIHNLRIEELSGFCVWKSSSSPCAPMVVEPLEKRSNTLL